MPTYQTSITVNAPVARVWEVLVAVEDWPALTASMTSVRPLDADGASRSGSADHVVAVGRRFAVEQPKLRKAVWTVTALDEGSRFSWRSAGPGVTTSGDHLVEPEGDGTRLTLVLTQRGALSGLVGLVAGGLTRRYLEMEARGLKERAESPAAE
ncbi:SRPBCC family protein [Streptomyces sp. NPDC088197]|uniref:SRPBCC family protein n=1 Tax=Streptomyces sp. NPDC088197 TaxID=3365840 RepID=UPI0037F66984